MFLTGMPTLIGIIENAMFSQLTYSVLMTFGLVLGHFPADETAILRVMDDLWTNDKGEM